MGDVQEGDSCKRVEGQGDRKNGQAQADLASVSNDELRQDTKCSLEIADVRKTV